LAAGCIAFLGISWCFIINGVSFTAVLVALFAMDPTKFHRLERATVRKRAVRDGLAYVRHEPTLRTTLIMLAIIGLLASEFPVTLPLIAKRTFHGGSSMYALFTAAMGIGAVMGGLFVAGRGPGTARMLARCCGAYGLAMAGAAAAPYLWVELACLCAIGATSIMFTARANATLQLHSRPTMRGRVMSLWAVALLGTTPLGAPLVGGVADYFGARFGLAVGAIGCLAAAALGLAAYARTGRRPDPTSAPPEAEGVVALPAPS
jgi:MFS family permease